MWSLKILTIGFALTLMVAPPLGQGTPADEAGSQRTPSPTSGREKAPEQFPSAWAKSGMLAFVSERDGNSEIYVTNVDGTGLLRLTDHAGSDVDPAWSPDGKRIAFASDRAGKNSDSDFYVSDIYVMDADGANLVRRTLSGSSWAPAWSADGKKIVFSSLRGGQRGIYVMSVDGDWANPTRVGYDRGWNTHPAWSPDGGRIAFVSDWRAYDFVYDVYVMNADGSQITTLFAGPFFGPWTYYFQPSWSPDGGKIAVVVCDRAWEDCYPSSSIAIANADGSGLKTLVQTSGYARPTWSPDGSTIAFSSQACSRGCEGELRYVSADGSKSGVIFSNGHSPAWRPYVDGLRPTVSSLSFNPITVSPGGTFTGTFSGASLSAETYFDVIFRTPGSNTDQEVSNWQQGTSATHTVPGSVQTGTYVVTAVRAHNDIADHSGPYIAVSASLTVRP